MIFRISGYATNASFADFIKLRRKRMNDKHRLPLGDAHKVSCRTKGNAMTKKIDGRDKSLLGLQTLGPARCQRTCALLGRFANLMDEGPKTDWNVELIQQIRRAGQEPGAMWFL